MREWRQGQDQGVSGDNPAPLKQARPPAAPGYQGCGHEAAQLCTPSGPGPGVTGDACTPCPRGPGEAEMPGWHPPPRQVTSEPRGLLERSAPTQTSPLHVATAGKRPPWPLQAGRLLPGDFTKPHMAPLSPSCVQTADSQDSGVLPAPLGAPAPGRSGQVPPLDNGVWRHRPRLPTPQRSSPTGTTALPHAPHSRDTGNHVWVKGLGPAVRELWPPGA